MESRLSGTGLLDTNFCLVFSYPNNLTKLLKMEKAINHSGNTIRIRDLLLAGKTLTVHSVLEAVGTQELRHYIPVIRRDFNLRIDSHWVSQNGKRFKEYYYTPQQIN